MRFWLVISVALFFLAGCGVVASPPPRAAVYDLRLSEESGDWATRPQALENRGPAVCPAALSLEVAAPSWLQGRAMQYRLEYRDVNRRQSYLESRWAAEPAEMVALALERFFTAPGVAAASSPGLTVAAPCRLRLALDEFVQVFVSGQESYALLVVRAELRPPGGESLVREEFVVRQATPTADAAGGVAGHRIALQRLAADLQSWLAVVGPATGCACRAPVP
jgi:cholesterol transport system auxiliary component